MLLEDYIDLLNKASGRVIMLSICTYDVPSSECDCKLALHIQILTRSSYFPLQPAERCT